MRSILLLLFIPFFGYGQLLINEFSARGGFEDNDGSDCDWVEVINFDSVDINLSEYFISDDITHLKKWRFPDEIISPMQLMVICLSGNNIRKRVKLWGALVDSYS